MPKLRRRIRQTQTQIAGGGISSGILNLPQTSTESSGLSQASSSQSVRDDKPMLGKTISHSLKRFFFCFYNLIPNFIVKPINLQPYRPTVSYFNGYGFSFNSRKPLKTFFSQTITIVTILI